MIHSAQSHKARPRRNKIITVATRQSLPIKRTIEQVHRTTVKTGPCEIKQRRTEVPESTADSKQAKVRPRTLKHDPGRENLVINQASKARVRNTAERSSETRESQSTLGTF
jgi:hypothetical protein